MTALLVSLFFAAAAAMPPPDPPDSLTLDQAIVEALRAEPGLRAARAELDASRGERQQAGLRPNPEVSFEQREQAGGADRQTSVAVELPVDWFRRGPRIESAARMVVRADATVRDRERLLAAAVRERYGDALIAARRFEVIDAVVTAARRTFELLANRVAEGAAPPLDRDLALVELRRLEGQRSIEDGRVAVALSGLKTLLGRPPSSAVSLADTLERLTVDEAPGDDGDRADVQAAAAELEVARAQTSLAMQERRPELNLFGSYMRMDAGFPQNGLSVAGSPEPIHGVFHNVAAGVKVSIPLFDRGQGTIAAAKARETAAAEALNGRRLGAAGEVAEATARRDAARAALSSYTGDTRSLARRNLDIVRETYTLGRATLLEVLSEQRRYLDFEAAYTEALAEAFAALTDLQRAKGAMK